VFRTGPTTSALSVYYNVGGTAIPGTDYQALSGNVTIDSGNPSQNIAVTALTNNTVTYDKTVNASLILTNTYFVGSPGQATLTIQDIDRSSVVPVGVATVNGPSGIDYHPVNSSLIISRSDTLGTDKNFKRVDSNGLVSNWTTLTGLGFTDDMGNQGEIKVGIVKITTNNWTQGDMYFGTGQPGKVGKISADGSTVVNTNWATLTNATQGVILLVNELVHLDQCSGPGLYIVHWDGGGFVVQEVPLPGRWEHATFAPIDIQ